MAGRDGRGPSRRATHSRVAPRIDPRLWLDEWHWFAWTLDGDLVAVEEIGPSSGRGSPRVRRITEEEGRQVSACGRLVDQVIKLYPGDSLDRPPVLRYLAHNDLMGALRAALVRAQAEAASRDAQRLITPDGGDQGNPAAQLATEQGDLQHRKKRFDPAGNYILFRPPVSARRLMPFFAILPSAPAPAAFPDRRSAQRARDQLGRLGVQSDGLQVARVLGSVLVEPVFRRDIHLPRFAEELVALVRSEPRVVVPELHVAWLPRYVEADDGTWTLQHFRNERTVRRAWQGTFLRELGEHVGRVVPQIEQNEILKRLGVPELRVHGADLTGDLVQRASRRLPRNWLERIGMEPSALAPKLSLLQARSFAPPTSEEGHWVRAPFEFRAHGVRKPQRHLVELRIDNLADVLELVGFKFRCLLIRESPQDEPRWVLPISELDCLVAGVA
jgi:hypothetical protein